MPEDDVNRQLANGFVLNVDSNRIDVLAEARGWSHVRDDFGTDHIDNMNLYRERIMVLLVDFDGDVPGRLRAMRKAIPADLRDRVFVLGVRTEPEELRRARGETYERIGRAMAEDCRKDSRTIWAHELLNHNEGELGRLSRAVRGWLFVA